MDTGVPAATSHLGAHLLQSLNIQRLEGQLCDVNIQVGDQSFPAHKAVLASYSAHFHTLFCNQNSGVIPFDLAISDITPDSFSHILEFMYTGKIPPEEPEHSDFIRVAKLFEMETILDLVIKIQISTAAGSTVGAGTGKTDQGAVVEPVSSDEEAGNAKLQSLSSSDQLSVIGQGMAAALSQATDGSADQEGNGEDGVEEGKSGKGTASEKTKTRGGSRKRRDFDVPPPPSRMGTRGKKISFKELASPARDDSPPPRKRRMKSIYIQTDGADVGEDEDYTPGGSPTPAPTRRRRRRHKRTDPADRKLECDKCGKKYSTVQSLHSHRSLHHGKKTYPCEECGQSFKMIRLLKRHQVEHTGYKPFQCDQCDRQFMDKGDMKRHERTVHSPASHVCEICDKRFKTLECFEKHKDKHLKDPTFKTKKSTQCDFCGEMFQTPRKMEVHRRKHTNDRPFQCELCGKGFYTLKDLKVHKRIHTGERPYKCTYCDAAFTQWSSWSGHQKTHTKEKPFLCCTCGKGFAEREYLKRHERTHTGERPFTCEVCGSGFMDRNGLRRHKRIHSDDRPYRCPHCNAGFKQCSNMKAHIKTHFKTANLVEVKPVETIDINALNIPISVQSQDAQFRQQISQIQLQEQIIPVSNVQVNAVPVSGGEQTVTTMPMTVNVPVSEVTQVAVSLPQGVHLPGQVTPAQNRIETSEATEFITHLLLV
ncbi:ZNF782 [Branchiostoma lanceolatum]|uniref:ZNF782 protein n=1 Tax=Branchiostoma lanceolatum TaxID=7740 RepID=A0A8K0AEC1_BRALA|nr:ZNF782 [Branchiostoma lanceolatum]